MHTEGAPELLDLLVELFEAQLARHAGPLPATVESFDQGKQTCDATPTIKVYVHGELVDLPALRNVPVMYPEGGGFSIKWPLRNPDVVHLLPGGWDIGPWLSSGSPQPQSRRRFSLSDVVALPFYPRPLTTLAPQNGYAADGLVIAGPLIYLGSSAAADFVALSSKVKSALDAHGQTINAVKARVESHLHTHPMGPTGNPVPAVPPIPDAQTSHDVASAKVRAE